MAMKIKLIKKSVPSKNITVADNPMFLRLVQVARDNKQFGTHLRRLLTLPKIDRLQEVEIIVAAMSKDNIPKDIINAAKALTDGAISQKVLDIIGRNS
jgi:predicted CopG family antitoxin